MACPRRTLLTREAAIKTRSLAALIFSLGVLSAAPAAACTNPNGNPGDILYNSEYGVFQGCTPAGWKSFHAPTLTPGGCSTSGLVGHWKFDESGNVSTANDSAGSNNGTLTGFPADPSANWVSGTEGGALDFDGSDDYVNMGDMLNMGDGQDFTLAGWFKRGTFTTNDVIVAGDKSGDGASRKGYAVYLASGTDRLVLSVADGTDEYVVESTAAFTSSNWYSFAAVWDDDNASAVKIYINGIDDSGTASGVLADVGDLTSSGDFRIGWWSGATPTQTPWFSGQLDDVRVYNRALSASEVNGLYNGGAGCQ